MKTLVKIFVIAFVAITMSTLTSCSTFKSSTLKRLDAEGIKPSKYTDVKYETWVEAEKTTYTLLVSPRFFRDKNPNDFMDEQVYLEIKAKNDITGEIIEAYAYTDREDLGHFALLEKGCKIFLYMEKDKLGRNRVLRGDIDQSVYY